jgi:hypothetical protein
MKLSKFNQFISESSNDLPPAVKLAKLGLADGLGVLDWQVDPTPDPDQAATVRVNWTEYVNWPNESEDDFDVTTQFGSDQSRGFIARRMMRFAKSSGLDWVYDREIGTWKKVE